MPSGNFCRQFGPSPGSTKLFVNLMVIQRKCKKVCVFFLNISRQISPPVNFCRQLGFMFGPTKYLTLQWHSWKKNCEIPILKKNIYQTTKVTKNSPPQELAICKKLIQTVCHSDGIPEEALEKYYFLKPISRPNVFS